MAAAPPGIVHAGEADPYSEDVEEPIVAGGRYNQLQEDQRKGTRMAQPPPAGDEKGGEEFGGEHEGAAQLVEPQGEMVGVPRQGGRQRLGLVMEGQGGKVPPRGVTARDLHGARQEHETEKEPPHEVAREARRLIRRGSPPECPRNQEYG